MIWLNAWISMPFQNQVLNGSLQCMENLARVKLWHVTNPKQTLWLSFTSVEAFFQHKFFAGTPQSTDPTLYPCPVKLGHEPKWRHFDILWFLRQITPQKKLDYFSEKKIGVRCTLTFENYYFKNQTVMKLSLTFTSINFSEAPFQRNQFDWNMDRKKWKTEIQVI